MRFTPSPFGLAVAALALIVAPTFAAPAASQPTAEEGPEQVMRKFIAASRTKDTATCLSLMDNVNDRVKTKIEKMSAASASGEVEPIFNAIEIDGDVALIELEIRRAGQIANFEKIGAHRTAGGWKLLLTQESLSDEEKARIKALAPRFTRHGPATQPAGAATPAKPITPSLPTVPPATPPR